MKEFWEWMQKMKYTAKEFPNTLHGPYTDVDFDYNKQMLIGYMIEFLYVECGGITVQEAFKHRKGNDPYYDFVFHSLYNRIVDEKGE